LQLLGEHGLDRVDHHHLWLSISAVARMRSTLTSGSSRKPVARQPQSPLRAQTDLPGRFLAADVQRPVVRRQLGQHLQQQGRLTDAGIATDQRHRTATRVHRPTPDPARPLPQDWRISATASTSARVRTSAVGPA
jgi:hypothetical protein